MLLFALLVLVLLQAQVLVLVAADLFPDLDRLAQVLLVQSVIMLVSALLAAWIMLRWIDRQPLRGLGFPVERRVPRDLAAGVAIGALALGGVVLVLAVFGAFGFTSAPGSLPEWLAVAGTALIFLALPAAAEEALFRGYPFRVLVEGAGPLAATLIMSVLFAGLHATNPNVDVAGLANIFAAGIMLSLAVLWTGSLWFATAVHLGWNWAMAGLLDLPVSGLDLFDAPLYDGRATGPRWLTGGEFGPEGGLAGTLAVLVAVALVWLYTRPGSRGGTSERKGDHDVGHQ